MNEIFMEAPAGFAPANNGVADRGLTAWLRRHPWSCFNIIADDFCFVNRFYKISAFYFIFPKISARHPDNRAPRVIFLLRPGCLFANYLALTERKILFVGFINRGYPSELNVTHYLLALKIGKIDRTVRIPVTGTGNREALLLLSVLSVYRLVNGMIEGIFGPFALAGALVTYNTAVIRNAFSPL